MRCSPLFALALLGLAPLGLACLPGCARDPLPQLLTVREVSPREVELGDRLEVTGAGFAQGRPAHVHLRGTAQRAGEDAEPVDVELVGDVVTPERIEIAVDDEVIGKLCGTGVHATHTTFDGAAEVAFAATTEGAPPVTGVASHVTLDAFPPSTPLAQIEARSDEGARFLKGAGLTLRGEADAFVVAAVAQGSAADRAGLLPGDVVVAASGLRVASTSDLAPPPSALSVPLAVRRGAAEHEEVHVIALEAASAPLSARLLVPALLVALALVLVLFAAGAPGRVVPWLRRRLHEGPRGSTIRELVPPGGAVVRYVLPTAALALAVAAPIAHAADVSALAFAVVFARILGALGGRAGGTTRMRLFSAVAAGVPLALVTATTIFTTGARSMGELAAASAGAPLGFAALRSPLHLALAATTLFAGVAPAVAAAEDPKLGLGARSQDARGAGGARFTSAWEWLAVWFQAALVALLHFGGWRVAGAGAAAGGAVYALKVVVLFVLAVFARAALTRQSPGALARMALLRFAPAALVLGVAARLWEEHVGARVVQMGAAVAAVAIALALGVALARRPGPVRQIGLDPFR